MTSVPERAAIKTWAELDENIEPRQRDEMQARISRNRDAGLTADDLLARIDPADLAALGQVMYRLATSYVAKLEAAGVTVDDLLPPAPFAETVARAMARRAGEQIAEPQLPSRQPKRRQPRSSPSRLAKWEAAWQAEQDAEAES
jgi:hypothetical protein